MRIFRHIMPVFLAISFESTQFADCCTKKVCLILCFASFLQKASTVTREHLFCRKQFSRIVGRPELLDDPGSPVRICVVAHILPVLACNLESQYGTCPTVFWRALLLVNTMNFYFTYSFWTAWAREVPFVPCRAESKSRLGVSASAALHSTPLCTWAIVIERRIRASGSLTSWLKWNSQICCIFLSGASEASRNVANPTRPHSHPIPSHLIPSHAQRHANL